MIRNLQKINNTEGSGCIDKTTLFCILDSPLSGASTIYSTSIDRDKNSPCQ